MGSYEIRETKEMLLRVEREGKEGMTDADVRNKVDDILKLFHQSPCLHFSEFLYRAAHADGRRDGMERAAVIAEEAMEYLNSSNGAFISAQLTIAAQIRQAAGEGK
ncbi:MAG TPA: hypothetical protein PKA61_07520 [Nitrospira sp.]|nr:hypothetical protein [Nitrospira sp.]